MNQHAATHHGQVALSDLSRRCADAQPDDLPTIITDYTAIARSLADELPAIPRDILLRLGPKATRFLDEAAYESFAINALPETLSFSVGHFPARARYVAQVMITRGAGADNADTAADVTGAHVNGSPHVANSILAAYFTALANYVGQYVRDLRPAVTH